MKYSYIGSLFLFITVVGCGGESHPETASVTGLITQDGQPVTSGRVVFFPTGTVGDTAGKAARGELDASGSFELSTYGNQDGAVLGDHKVTVLGGGDGEAKAIGTLKPTTVTVKKGENDFSFILETQSDGNSRNGRRPPADREEVDDDE